MITPMRHITLICCQEDAQQVLESLQEFGEVHLHSEQVTSHDIEQRTDAIADARAVLQKLQLIETPTGTPPEEPPEACIQRAQRLAQTDKELLALEQKLAKEAHLWAPFGDLSLATLSTLRSEGLFVTFLKTNQPPEDLPEGSVWLPGDPGVGIVVSTEELENEHTLDMPVRGPALIAGRREHIARIREAREFALQALATRVPELEEYIASLEEGLEFQQAHAGMAAEQHLSWIEGYLPEERLAVVEAKAEEWGIALTSREPTVENPTPTLLQQSSFVSWIQPVFSFLGVTPGYQEVDVGWSFLIFLSVFSGMIIGDAGYGLFLLGLVGGLNLIKPATRGKFSNLLLLMAGATTIWGFLTGNLFGIAGMPAVFPELSATADPKAIMNVCFLLGASHLTLAHVWNLWRKRTSLQALAELGWIGSTWTMYGVTGQMVLGWESVPSFLMPVFLLSVILIVLFMTPPKEFKENWVDHMMLPLTFVNNFVDVVSYVRLYAVGMATFALASSFNAMLFPEGAERPLWQAGISAVILILGHALNFILAGMGVMVHGIRLNTLEFASHLGLTWSGVPYKPFRKQSQT